MVSRYCWSWLLVSSKDSIVRWRHMFVLKQAAQTGFNPMKCANEMRTIQEILRTISSDRLPRSRQVR
jgi:hypothetical protein